MYSLSRWIRKWRDERQLIKETEAREAERRNQREKQNDQQAQALLLTLNELQRTVDPLIAVQIYNNRFCPLISRLPEELILCIIDFLCDDVVALQCVRIVSRLFLRLLNRRSAMWREAWYKNFNYAVKGNPFYLHDALRLQFRRLLQRDGRCDNCKRWNAANDPLFKECEFRHIWWRGPGIVDSRCHVLYCHACDSLHDLGQFYSAYELSLKRKCLGQRGSVQLCEHIQITWASIEAHINDWRQDHPEGDWQDCLKSFNVECHDASHDTHCTVSEAPTWPRARLGTGATDSGIVVLNLEWKPHICIDALALTADGRIPAPELRAQFQRLRSQGPTDTLYPPCRPGALPEMAFFSPSSLIGRFVYYKAGEDDEIVERPPSAFPPLPEWWLWPTYLHSHGRGRNGKKLDIRPHYPRGARGTGILSQCLVISYEKDIMICKTTAMTQPVVKIVPTHPWLHAMDPNTYPYPQASQIRPRCRDLTCTNYYLNRRDSYTCFR